MLAISSAGRGVKTRPEWLESAVGQGLALLLALVIALGLGSIIILLYGENPLHVYGSILRASTTDKDGPAWVLSAATPLIFSALAVSVCFKGGLFNIGVEGQYLVGMATAAWAARPTAPAPSAIRAARGSAWRCPPRAR